MNNLNIDGHKLHYHPERVAQSMEGESSKLKTFPIYVEISPIGICNHRCTFCALDYIGYVNTKIGISIMEDLLLNLSLSGIKSVMFAGEGEPLLHKDLAHFVNYATHVGLDVAITTNGTLIDEDFIDECLHNISWIKISCNAGTEEIYKSIHKAKDGDWDKVWKNITYACIVNDNKNPRTIIGVQAVALPENIGSLEELGLISKLAGVDYTVIKPYSQHKRSKTTEYKDITYEGFNERIKKIAANLSDTNFHFIIREESINKVSDTFKGYNKCYSVPFFWAYIMASGDVYGCSAYLLDERFRYGNINEKSFYDIWTGEARKRAITFIEEELDISECRKNCRMDKANSYLHSIKEQNVPHMNFI